MKKILVAITADDSAEPVICRGCRLAERHRAEVEFLHVAAADAADDAIEQLRETLKERIGCRSSAPVGSALEKALRVERGDPATLVVERASAIGADLIVIGGHGEPRFRDALFGTTGEHVMTRARQPLLIVQNDSAATYVRPLIPVEGPELATLVGTTVEVAEPKTVTLARARDTGLFGAARGEADASAEEQALERDASAILPGSAGRMPEVRAIVASGDFYELLWASRDLVEPDLVVVGTHQRTGLKNLLLGSHAEALIPSCSADILIVPLRQDEALAA